MSATDEFVLPTRCGNFELPPANFHDPVIEAYKKNVDRAMLRENLKLTPTERFQKLQRFMRLLKGLHTVGRKPLDLSYSGIMRSVAAEARAQRQARLQALSRDDAARTGVGTARPHKLHTSPYGGGDENPVTDW